MNKKNSIYVEYNDILTILNFHNLKPLPLKPVLTELK
jgi:hypothetical protein